MTPDTPFKLDDFTITPFEYRVCKSAAEGDCENQTKVLQPKVMEVLVYLAAHYPQLVSRKELIENIWHGNFPVGEKTLTNAIWHIRQALEQDDQPIIRTVRKSGYSLLTKPEYLDETSAEQPTQDNKKSVFEKLTILSIVFALAVKLTPMLPSAMFTSASASSINKITNMTTAPGRELYPAVSPDGKTMVYLWRKVGSQSDLYLKQLDRPKAKPKQLTFGDAREYQPVWSRDGKSLYFPQKTWDNRRCDIVQLTLSTKVKQQIAPCPVSREINLALSNDGKILAFTSSDDINVIPGIYFLDLTNNNAIPQRFSCADNCAFTDIDFAFSPDDQSIAVSRRVESLVENLFVIDLHTQQTRQITFGEGDIKGFAWHPQGDKIIFALAKSNRREGFVVDVNSTKTTALNIPGFSYPNFIPDSLDMVYHQWQIRTYIAQVGLSEDTPMSPFPLLQSKFDYHSAHYTSANKRLVFTSNESGYNEIWTANLLGGERKKMTELKSELSLPRWSHDGQTIVFLGPKQKQLGNNIYLLDRQTQNVRLLSSDFDGHFRPGWSHDDQNILAVALKDNQRRLYRIPIQGGKPQKLLEHPVQFAVQDKQQIIWFTRAKNDGLWQLNQSKTQDNITQWLTSEQFKVRYNWTVTDEGIYFQHDFKNHHKINFYDFASHTIKPMLKLPIRTIERSAPMLYLPDEHKLLFTQSEFPQVDIKRLHHPLL